MHIDISLTQHLQFQCSSQNIMRLSVNLTKESAHIRLHNDLSHSKKTNEICLTKKTKNKQKTASSAYLDYKYQQGVADQQLMEVW